MTFIIATCPPGREGDAILELEWALVKVRVKGTGWRGVLFAETPLEKEEVVKRISSFETQALQRVVPLDVLVPSRVEEITKAALRLMKGKKGSFAVRAKVRGNKKLGEKAIERKVGAAVVREHGLPVDLDEPDWVVAVEGLEGKTGVGVLKRGELLKFEVKE